MADNSDDDEQRAVDAREGQVIPAVNEIAAQVGREGVKYPDESDELRYLILFPEDYQGHGVDVAGNVALLLNEENAREVKRLAEEIIGKLNEND